MIWHLFSRIFYDSSQTSAYTTFLAADIFCCQHKPRQVTSTPPDLLLCSRWFKIELRQKTTTSLPIPLDNLYSRQSHQTPTGLVTNLQSLQGGGPYYTFGGSLKIAPESQFFK